MEEHIIATDIRGLSPLTVAFLLGVNEMEERRMLPRWQINRSARLKFKGMDNSIDCQVKDINQKGMQVIVGEGLASENLPLCLDIELDNGYVLDAQAAIAWHADSGVDNTYGLYFTRLRDADREKIYQLIRTYCPEQFKQRMWGS